MEPQKQDEAGEINPLEGLKKEIQRLKDMVATLEHRILDGEESLRAMCNIACTDKDKKS